MSQNRFDGLKDFWPLGFVALSLVTAMVIVLIVFSPFTPYFDFEINEPSSQDNEGQLLEIVLLENSTYDGCQRIWFASKLLNSDQPWQMTFIFEDCTGKFDLDPDVYFYDDEGCNEHLTEPEPEPEVIYPDGNPPDY